MNDFLPTSGVFLEKSYCVPVYAYKHVCMCVEYMHVKQAEIAVEYLMWGSGGEAGYMPPLLPASRRIQKARPTNENLFYILRIVCTVKSSK
jgi:hypothetical protein